MLTSQEIQDIVDRVRQWLLESNEELEDDRLAELFPHLNGKIAPPEVGLLQLVEIFTALRQDIKLQAKSVKGVQEALALGMGNLEQATRSLHDASSEVRRRAEKETERLLESAMELDEAVEHALTTCRRIAEQDGDRETTDEKASISAFFREQLDRLPRWRRVFVQAWGNELSDAILQRQPAVARRGAASYIDGLQILQTKLRRTLAGFQVERVDCTGKLVDPQQMRVVATANDSNLPAGTVVEVLRPGYVRDGKVLRPAEVKAAID